MATDNVKPAAASLDLKILKRTQRSITIGWSIATDNVSHPSNILYRVYMTYKTLWTKSSRNTTKLVLEAKQIGSYTASNLSPLTRYTFTVKAIDEAGNELVYNSITTNCAPSSSTSSGSSSSNSTSSNTTSTPSATAIPTPTTDEQRRDQINDGLRGRISLDNAKALTIRMPSEEALPEYMESGNYVLHLEKEKHDVNDPKDTIFAANFDNIYPGAIVFANGYLADGDPVLCGLDPGTVTVRVNFNTGGVSSKSNVENTAHAIQDAIFEILNKSKYGPKPNVRFKDHYVSSVNEMAATLNVSASFLKIKADVKTSATSKESSITRVQDYTQEYYTVAITQESDKSKYFGPKVTWAKILETMGQYANAPLAIITSVTYGRKAYKFTDFASSSFKFDASLSASGGGQSVSSTVNLAQSSEAKSTWMYIDGGDADSAGTILRGEDIDKAISGEDGKSKLQFNVETSQGVPLYYTVRFLASGITAKVSTIGSYTTVSYKPLPSIVSCTYRNNCTHVAGGRLKMRLDFDLAYLSGGRKVPYAHKIIEHEIAFGDKITFPLIEEEKGKVLFLDGLIRLQLRGRMYSNAGWYDHVVGTIYPQDGRIDLDVRGAIRRGGTHAYIHSSSYTKDITNT